MNNKLARIAKKLLDKGYVEEARELLADGNPLDPELENFRQAAGRLQEKYQEYLEKHDKEDTWYARLKEALPEAKEGDRRGVGLRSFVEFVSNNLIHDLEYKEEA